MSTLRKILLFGVLPIGVASWLSLNWLDDFWAKARPRHPIPDEGYTWYYKGARAVVYLNDADHVTSFWIIALCTVSTVSFVALVFLVKLEDDET